MAQARLYAGLWPQVAPGRTRRAGLTATAGRPVRAVVSHPEELLRDQGIQFLRSLRSVRRPSERSHRRQAAVRDAVGDLGADADRAGRAYAATADPGRALRGQDRR